MKKKEMRAELRLLLDDTVEPFGWSNNTLDNYLSEGMDAFCAATGFWVDFQNFTFTTTANVADYQLDPNGRIIETLEIWNTDLNTRLSQFDNTDRPEFIPTTDVQQTQLFCWQADQITGYVTLYPTPTSSVNLKARVWRYPLVSFLDMGETDTPELPVNFHRAPLEYCAFKAYNHHDREQANAPKARDHFMLYQQYVSDGKKAFQRMRSTHPRIGCNPLYVFS